MAVPYLTSGRAATSAMRNKAAKRYAHQTAQKRGFFINFFRVFPCRPVVFRRVSVRESVSQPGRGLFKEVEQALFFSGAQLYIYCFRRLPTLADSIPEGQSYTSSCLERNYAWNTSLLHYKR